MLIFSGSHVRNARRQASQLVDGIMLGAIEAGPCIDQSSVAPSQEVAVKAGVGTGLVLSVVAIA